MASVTSQDDIMNEKLSLVQQIYDLTDIEETQLENFKSICNEKGLYHSSEVQGQTQNIHDDSTLL